MTSQERQNRQNRIASMKDFVKKAEKAANDANSVFWKFGLQKIDLEGLCPELKGYDKEKAEQIKSWLWDAKCLLEILADDEKLLARLADYYRKFGDPKRLKMPWSK